MRRHRPSWPSASRSQLRCDSGHRPDPTRQKTRTLGNVSRNFQRNHNPGKGKPKSTEYIAALGKSSFHLFGGTRLAFGEGACAPVADP